MNIFRKHHFKRMEHQLIEAPRTMLRGIFHSLLLFIFVPAITATDSGECTRRIQPGQNRYRLFLLLPVILLLSCGDQSGVSITGEIEEGQGKTLYLDRIELAGPQTQDSTVMKSPGRFRFSAKITSPGFFRIRLEDNNFITLLAEPGERISVRANASNLPGTYEVSGSEGSALVKKLNDRLAETQRQIKPLVREIISLEEGPEFEQEAARIEEELDEIIQSQRKFSIAFILENMESLASITALYQQLDDDNYVLGQTRDIQYMKIVAESLTKKYPGSPHVKALASDAANQERQYELYKLAVMAEQSGQVVTTYPDIAMPGADGDTIRLHSVEERYILLLFGSSLNPGSVQFSQELLPVYRTYHPKGFEIFQVSVERDREEWLRSIEFSELPWIHVAELGDGTFSAALAYNVQQIPSNYLIHRDAGVVARNISVPDLRRRLSRAFD